MRHNPGTITITDILALAVVAAAAAGAVIFHAATGLDAHAIAAVATQVRQRVLRLFALERLREVDGKHLLSEGTRLSR